jgi:hypothetical protein
MGLGVTDPIWTIGELIENAANSGNLPPGYGLFTTIDGGLFIKPQHGLYFYPYHQLMEAKFTNQVQHQYALEFPWDRGKMASKR